MNNLIIQENIKIEDLIYEIRGEKVMLDSDLAKLYQCSNGTKDINKAVKRNIDRFPSDFYFQLNIDEYKKLQFQIGTTNNMSRTLPHVFTEQGVAMLSSVLRTSVAEEVSVKIMRAFVNMKKYISTSLIEHNYYKDMLLRHDNDIKLLFDKFDNEKNNHIFFKGQIYDAYSLMMDILNVAKEEIIIIDNYAGKELFDLIKDIKVSITIYSKNINEEAILKYKKQYNNISIFISNSFHDRFIILDRKVLYHCGSSFKDLGKSCFAINKLEDEEILNNILMYLR